jgi:hypothetical protein
MKSTLAAGLLMAAIPASFMGFKSITGVCPLSLCCGGESQSVAVANKSGGPTPPSAECCSLRSPGETLACSADEPCCADEKAAGTTLASASTGCEPCEFCD